MPYLIAYLVCAEPDIIHLQQLGPTFTPVWLRGLPYAVKVGPLFAGGDLAIVLHQRFISGTQVKTHPQEHCMCVKVVPAWGVSVATFNVHLPLLLPASYRCTVVSNVAAFLKTTGTSGWLSKAPSAKGPWTGFRSPYLPGQPTNVVWQLGRPSESELD